jgi:hypothetical protein
MGFRYLSNSIDGPKSKISKMNPIDTGGRVPTESYSYRDRRKVQGMQDAGRPMGLKGRCTSGALRYLLFKR